MKLHENASRWRFVCNLDRLQLPSRTAGDAGSLHFKALFLQNRCKPADRTKANAINIQPHHSKGWIQKTTKTAETSSVAAKAPKPNSPQTSNGSDKDKVASPLTTTLRSSGPPPQPVENTKSNVETNVNVAASGPVSEPSDPVLEKAKATVASKMEDRASVEFEDMTRAIRHDTFGQSIDTICGHVRGKKTSGAETAKRAFLYLVKEDIAFVDYGYTNSQAANAYRAICTRGKSATGH